VGFYNWKILIIDNEIDIAHLLMTRFNELGFEVFFASNGIDAISIFNKQSPDLIILEIVLPKLDGYELCRKFRNVSQVQIIILTVLDNVSNRLIGLEIGADDYIVKPFSLKELEARVKSMYRRSDLTTQSLPKKINQIYSIGNLTVDMDAQKISKKNLQINLTNLEHSILKLLMENMGEGLSRPVILDKVWGYIPERNADARIVDVHISRLRLKLEENPNKPDFILTVRGKGYMFKRY
jgi:OmpR family response regulator RpaB